jgi:sporulation protein YunB
MRGETMRRRRALRKRSRLRPWLCLAACLAAVWLLLVWADARLRPQLYALAAMQAMAGEEHALNDAVLSAIENDRYASLVTVEQNDSGRVTSVRTDAVGINLLKGRVCEAASAVLASHSQVVCIPAGSLTGLDILAGRGPSIRVPVRTSGFANADVESAFEGAGVNQTVHRLLLRVHASVCLSMAKTQQTKSLSYEICIAETVIVGEVPALYANMNNGE